jgi:hypothetical protein
MSSYLSRLQISEAALENPNIRQPTNSNFLNQNYFAFQLERLPNTSFFCTSVIIPSMSIGIAEQPTRFGLANKMPGNKSTIEDFSINFIVDEDIKNYQEIRRWLRESIPFSNFKEVKPSSQWFSDATVFILNSAKRPNFRIIIKNCFPTYLSSLTLSSDMSDQPPITAVCNFAFTDYDIESVK